MNFERKIYFGASVISMLLFCYFLSKGLGNTENVDRIAFCLGFMIIAITATTLTHDHKDSISNLPPVPSDQRGDK